MNLKIHRHVRGGVFFNLLPGVVALEFNDVVLPSSSLFVILATQVAFFRHVLGCELELTASLCRTRANNAHTFHPKGSKRQKAKTTYYGNMQLRNINTCQPWFLK